MTEAVRSPWSPLSLSLEALFDFLEGTEEETRTSSLVNPSTDHPSQRRGVALIHLAVIDSNYLKTFN